MSVRNILDGTIPAGLSIGYGIGDIRVVTPDQVSSDDDAVRLIEVKGVAWRCAESLPKILDMLRDDPTAAEPDLQVAFNAALTDCKNALDTGADGVFYRLYAADPAHTTPMEYGGNFLELERSVLDSISKAFNVVYVETSPEPYIDFLTDLPGSILAWSQGPTVESIRFLTNRTIGHDSEAADVALGQIPTIASGLQQVQSA